MSTFAENLEEKLSNLLDDRDFLELDTRHQRFNLFSALGAVRNELRHSNFLKFLLSPNESHGLGAAILTQVLRLFLSKCKPEVRKIASLELMLADLDNAIVERERNNIDILIEVSSLKLVVAIENKVKSPVREGQLTEYKEVIRRRYGGWCHLFVLLTPEAYDPGPYDPDYVACGYAEIVEILNGHLEERCSSLSAEVTLILTHYVEILRGSVVDDEKLTELAQRLYYKHKDAFDFVFRNRPDLLDPIRALIDSEKTLVADRSNPMLLRFAPSEWGTIVLLNSCPPDKWTRTRRNLLFEVKAFRDSERISLGLVLGPANNAFREFVYLRASKNPSVFKNLVKPMGVQYSTIYTRDLLSGSAAENMDQGEITSIWQSFLREDMLNLKSEIQNIVHSFEQQPENQNRGATP
jgi:hypothetical protein